MLFAAGKQVVEPGKIFYTFRVVILDDNTSVTVINLYVKIGFGIQRILNWLTHQLIQVTTPVLLNPSLNINTEDILFYN
ncbi:hypothetical protein SAMN04487946_101582 [Halobellus clavatus]|uniref:Uncharacterized protein n=1 Tax=Halobellus clavatus TaxID=660517 RepID=A0A1H3DHS4_9EURY|nr:hypothetical protein SAMN04487946_101582 [Halobellus clavatus]